MALKRGVHKDIFNGSELAFSKTVIRKFLKIYTAKKKYRELHIENTPRYDLEGNKVDIITKEDVELSKKQQEEIKKSVEAKRRKKQELKNNKNRGENNPNNQDKVKDANPNKDGDYKLKKATVNQDDLVNTKSTNSLKPKLGLKL